MANDTQTPMQPQSIVSQPARVAVTPRPVPARPGGLKRIFSFLGWVFSGFGLIPALLKKDPARRRQEIVVYSAHRAFNLWALILTGFVGAWAANRWPAGKVPLVFGWIYIWVTLYTFLTLVFDVSTWKLLLWAGIFTFVWLLSRYLGLVRDAPFLKWVTRYLKDLHPAISPGVAAVMSWLLLVPWIGSLFLTFTNGRKKFTPNEITEWYVGEGSELIDRTGLKFRTRYRDILESVLGFGAGDLIAYDNRQNVIKRYESILFLIFLWPRINDILEERSATVDTAPGDAIQIETTSAAPRE